MWQGVQQKIHWFESIKSPEPQHMRRLCCFHNLPAGVLSSHRHARRAGHACKLAAA